MILARFVELDQKLLIIDFMDVLTLASFGKISKFFWFALFGKHVGISLQDALICKLEITF